MPQGVATIEELEVSAVFSAEQPGPVRTAISALVMMICGAAFAAIALSMCMLALTGNDPGKRDFVSYWTAAHQLIQHQNPYDRAAIGNAERAVGFPAISQALIMRNAPWALCLVLPMGLLGLKTGALAWSALLLCCLIRSVHLLRKMNGSPAGTLQVLAYGFGPALICVMAGQTAVIALLGLVLFLQWHRARPFLAGSALWFCAIKPHLFLPFGVALIGWALVSRSYRLLAGFAATIAASSLLVTWIDAQAWMQYAQMMHTAGIEGEFMPCLSVALRFAIHRQAMWIEYLPAAAACIWAAIYFARNRHRWNWMEHGALLMLISVAAAPYAWLMDQALLIPAVLVGVYRARSRGQLETLAIASAVVEMAMTFGPGAHSIFYLWTAPFFLAWYLIVTRTNESGPAVHLS